MFTALSAFFTTTALGRFVGANLWKVIGVFVLIALGAYAYFSYTGMEKSLLLKDQTILAQQTTLAQQKQALKEQADQLRKLAASQQLDDQAQASTHAAQAAVVTTYVTKEATVKNKVKAIEATDSLNPVQKASLENRVYIDDLWLTYCDDTADVNATCEKYKPAAVPAAASAQVVTTPLTLALTMEAESPAMPESIAVDLQLACLPADVLATSAS